MGERLRSIRKALGLTQSQLAETLGVGKAAVAMIETGHAGLSSRNRNILIKRLNVSPDFLDSGRGAIFNSGIIPSLSEENDSVPFQKVPLYTPEELKSSSSLFSADISKSDDECIHIPNLSKCDGAIQISTDSMYPMLRSGDIVLYRVLSDASDIIWGEMYILLATMNGEKYLLLRNIHHSDREGFIRLSSQNPSYSDKEISLEKVHSIALVKASIRICSM